MLIPIINVIILNIDSWLLVTHSEHPEYDDDVDERI